MTLKEYLKKHKLTLDQFVMKSGLSYSYCTKIYAGNYVGKGAAYMIESMTNGEIKAKDIFKPAKKETFEEDCVI